MSAATWTNGTAAPASSPSVTSLLLKPVLMLTFALLHVVYQVVLLVRQAGSALKNATKFRPAQPPASYTSLDDLLAAHEWPSNAIRVPNHLAVVLVDAEPSSIRLYLSRLFSGFGRSDATVPGQDVWHDFRSRFQTAVLAKHCSDIAAIVHLARISGVQKLSIYTAEPLPSSVLQSLTRTLQVGYRTKAVFAEAKEEAESDQAAVNSTVGATATTWSKYDELRRRRATAMDEGSDSSSSSPASQESSDSEAAPSSLDDETLASSYTADSNDTPLYDATVHIRVGLETRDNNESSSAAGLKVTLLSRLDGQQRFASLVSAEVRSRCSTHLSNVITPDIDAAISSHKRISSSLRKAWMPQRARSNSDLTVATLDRTLAEAGYISEPDLLVVFGATTAAKKLYGFPAWPLRVTDLFYDANARGGGCGYGAQDWTAALSKLARMEQRYGR
ncbi:hypothetical protein EX895_000244 [Sporisorium graminicola]|uniref:ditrans,polycis-polyprenyl diphosphate synthase [(2E,6E)-farnesyldiphosphate specific] n=1 Tax=Sporisorium graminicola TaxID=280036 RepID=A0A4U7L0L4_9BASI|nr:hypothetical protein EX895_000244 [Sporisorium graminicola]TKY90246.1 hypothetical protein EX895_000244 [Sporisorium graminicola]